MAARLEIDRFLNDLQQWLDQENRQLLAAVKDWGNPQTQAAALVLRFHVLCENALERIIVAKLPRAEGHVEGNQAPFAEKLDLCRWLEAVPDSVYASAKALNKLRNRYAHNLECKPSPSDMLPVGKPLDGFAEIEAALFEDLVAITYHTCKLLYAGLLGAVARCERPAMFERVERAVEQKGEA